MKLKNNSIFKRVLSFVMVVLMLVPFCTMLFPIVASAEEVMDEITETDTTPKVSLAWDTSTVTVTDGVAMPHKCEGANGKPTYILTYKIIASGDIVEPIKVTVKSFDLSATAGEDYVAVNNTVTLTQENPEATGTVTVKTQRTLKKDENGNLIKKEDGEYDYTLDYVTCIQSSGEVFTQEFGLRIASIENAKKESGKDTLRSKVLASSGNVLYVHINSAGTNYGHGDSAFQVLPNGYVYDGMARDFTYNFPTIYDVEENTGKSAKWICPLESGENTEVHPSTIISKDQSGTLKLLREVLYPDDMEIWLGGWGRVTDDKDGKRRKGFIFKIVYTDESTRDDIFVSYLNHEQKDVYQNHFFEWPVEDGLDTAYSRSEDNPQILLFKLRDDIKYHPSVINREDSIGLKSKKTFNLTYSTIVANSKPLEAVGYSLENTTYVAGDTVYLSVKFNKPVQVEEYTNKPLIIEARIDNSVEKTFYFEYCGGNMTDTLVFKTVLPEDGDYCGKSFKLIGFKNADCYNGQKNRGQVSDMFWNTSNVNNVWTIPKSLSVTLPCSVDMRTPEIGNAVVSSETAKSSSFKVTVSNITKDGTIEYAWTNDGVPPASSDGWEKIGFLANDRDETTVTLEKYGESGKFYAHLKVTGVSGNQSVRTFGPIYLDNDAPVINPAESTNSYNYSRTQQSHEVAFSVNDEIFNPADGENSSYSPVSKIYMSVKDNATGGNGLYYKLLDKNDGYYDDVVLDEDGNLCVYPIEQSNNLLRLTKTGNGSYAGRISVGCVETTDGIKLINLFDKKVDTAPQEGTAGEANGLPTEEIGYFEIQFYAIDHLGNKSVLTRFTTWKNMSFDTRETFPMDFDEENTILNATDPQNKGEVEYTSDKIPIVVHDRAVQCTEDGKTYTKIYVKQTQVDGSFESNIKPISFKCNGTEMIDPSSGNELANTQNIRYELVEGADKSDCILNISTDVEGYVEVIFQGANADKQSSVVRFYIYSSEGAPKNYNSLYAEDRLLKNEVWKLSTSMFYSYTNRNGTSYNVAGVLPVFSSKDKALEFAKFFEKQDISIEHIDNEVEKNNLEGGYKSTYRKANSDKDVVVKVGQTWIRYKSDTWEIGDNNEEQWVYYFYSDPLPAGTPPIDTVRAELTPSLNAAIERNAKLICNYNGNNTVYLTANNSTSKYIDSNGEPYYNPYGILKETKSYKGCYSGEIKCQADTAIYDNFITVEVGDGYQQVPIIANYTFNVDTAQRAFVAFRQYDSKESGKWIFLENGESLKKNINATGIYEIKEAFGEEYREYLVYVDVDAPVISYDITVDGDTKPGYVTSSTSGGSLRASNFVIKGLVNYDEGTLPIELDRWAYFYVVKNGELYAFMTVDELNANGLKLETGIYKIYASDRLGNTVMQTVKLNTEDLKVEVDTTAKGIKLTINRKPSEIEPGSFKIWRDNELLEHEEYASTKEFTRSGVYRMEFSDIYGNSYSRTFEPFVRPLPTVSFYRQTKEGTKNYEQIIVNSHQQSNLANVTTEDDQTFIVSTSANIRISYPLGSGYGFEFIGDKPEYKYDVVSTSTIDIKSTESNWKLKIFHKNDPDVYIIVACVVDKENPVISATVQAKEYDFNEYNSIDNVLFRGTGYITTKPFYSGERAVGDSAIVSWSDDTQISRVSYTKNGGEIVEVSAKLSSVELKDIGYYVFEAKDVFGNATTFEFLFTDRIDFGLMLGENEVEIKRDPENYIVGNGYTDTAYTGREVKLTLNENALVALYYTDGSKSCIYNLEFEVNEGGSMLNILAYNDQYEEFAVIENGTIALGASGKIFDGDLVVNYTYQNGILTLILPECQKAYELWQFRISDNNEHCPSIVQIERSNNVPQMDIVKEDGTKLDLSYDGYIGSNQILILDENSVSDDTVEIIAYYSENYTDSFENAAKIVLYGKDATPFLEKEGYYKIVAVNKYGNQREIFVAISFKLSLDVHISYAEIGTRTQTLKNPDSYMIFSNNSVSFKIWDERASVVCQKDGNEVELVVTQHNGYLEFTMEDFGEYVVIISDESGNVYTLTVSIKEPHEITYEGYLTGFNEIALKKDQNYTNGAVTLDKQKLVDGGIKYVAFRKVGTNQFSVLYDLISTNPIEYSQSEYNGIIGKEDGEYEILFCDAYGNLHTEIVRISRKPMLSVNRQTQNASESSSYDFDFALINGAWSNYTLTFISTSEKYSLKVNGEAASFSENGYTFVLPADLGVAEETYVLEYVDDYGNSYTINVYLYRAIPESSVSEGADTVSSNGKMYARNDFSLMWSERVTATYSLNGGAEEAFEMDKVFTEDGEYTITFTDYAGNTSTRIITKDSTVLYNMSCNGNDLHTGGVVSSKVSLSFDEELSFTVTKDGQEYDAGSKNFTEDGYYVVTLTDAIGNVETFTFTIYAKAKQSFTFTVPEGYSFSQIWNIQDGHKVSLVSDVTWNENGVQTYTFTADGKYEVELLHMESEEICYFNLTIDNIAPETLLVGAENGGVTRSNVSLEGLTDGDRIYVYKNGELITTYIVNGSSENMLELLGNGDFGAYTVVIEDEAGNSVSYEFTKEFATNTYSNIFICLLLVFIGVVGIIYIRFNGKVRTK